MSEGRRQEFAAFGWEPEEVPDPQDPATFAASVLRWDELGSRGHADVLDWYRALIALRRSRPGLATGPLDDVAVTFDEDARWLVVHRRAAGVSVAVNLGHTVQDVPVADAREVVLASPPDGVTPTAAGLRLPADGVAVVATG